MTDFHDDDTQFWDDGGSSRSGQLRRLGHDVTGQIRRIAKDHDDRHHFERTRGHRAVRAEESASVHVAAYDYDLEDRYAGLGRATAHDPSDDALWAGVDAWVEPETGSIDRRAIGGVDRRLLRLGVIAAAAVVLLPVAVSIASGDDSNGGVRTNEPDAAAIVPGEAGDDPTSTLAPVIPVSAAASMPASSAGDNPADDDQEFVSASLNGVVDKAAPQAADENDDETASASAEAAAQTASTEPECASTYTVVDGDYWLRFVDDGATLDDWLAANGATAETPLYTGDELCVPNGATAPA
ncbi:MAG: hypothetical protein H0W46_13035, partial [Acidimicrobiia bacterium]|nr:hypothetical protein [Acidimicrobiia bacterium]